MREIFILCVSIFISSCAHDSTTEKNNLKTTKETEINKAESINMTNKEIATFANGCFWCTEAIFQSLDGVEQVKPGYSGGYIDNPTYKEVCEGTTGHAEVVQIVFDSAKISYKKLLEVFFETHDPTTINKQGNDVGEQYRSEVFFHNEDQRKMAEIAIQAVDESGVWKDTVVTKVTGFEKFYEAEDYHKNYYKRVGDENSYCTFVITPKIEKFKKKFSDLLKKEV